LALAGSPVDDWVMLDTGPAQAENAGRVMPVELVSGFSRPDSPLAPIAARSMAALIALRTGSWLVGHWLRFGMRAFELSAPSQ